MNNKHIGHKKITKDDVNKRLADRGIVLLGEYLKSHSKTTFQCYKRHIWSATPANVLYGFGCPYCSGNIPLTKQIVNERIADRGLVMLSEYINQRKKALFKCAEGHTWETAPSNVLYENGCPKCAIIKRANKKRLTVATISKRLSNRNIELIDEYLNANAKTLFRCKDGHTWKATPGSVMSGNGCPHCAGRVPLTKEMVNERITDRGITMLGNYKGIHAKTLFMCKEGHKWKTTASCVIYAIGCPHCNGQAPLSKQIINKRLANRGIIMLGGYKNVDTKTLFKCTEGHTWETTPYHVTRKPRPTSCPYCSNMAPLSTAIINDRIKDRGYMLLDEFKTNHIKVRFQCREGHTWKAKPNNILNGRGCPECAPRTSDNDVFYLWVANSQKLVDLQVEEFLIKYGTTSERLKNNRIREVSSNWKATPNVLVMIKTLEPATLLEQTASQIGQRLTSDYSHLDGYTEFRIVNKNELIQLISIVDAVAEYKIVWNNLTLLTEQFIS